MNKQKEIREGLAEGLFKYNNPYEEWGMMPRQTQDTFRSRANRMLLWLNEQGVVIKVDCQNCQNGYVIFRTNKTRCSVCKGNGYVATEPLIDN